MLMSHLAGTGFPLDEAGAAEYAAGAWNRGLREAAGDGVARQINAIYKSGDRTVDLAESPCPRWRFTATATASCTPAVGVRPRQPSLEPGMSISPAWAMTWRRE